VLRTQIGFDAVGIRLQDGQDFPYFAQEGFSEYFLLSENSLVERSADGGVCRDKDGCVRLEGTCGLVLSGRTDPAHPLFTPGGSFWTNDFLPVLDLPSDPYPRLHSRNQCLHSGYASMALVPIRGKDSVVGLIQLNDRRKGRLTLDTVEFLERIASHIGSALMRKRAEALLRESEARYSIVLAAVSDGFWDWHVPSGNAFFSPLYYTLLGYDDGEFPASYASWHPLVHPEDIDRVEQILQQSINSGESFSIDLRMKMKSGAWLWGCIRGKAIERDAEGKALRMVGTLSDITERKRSEEHLQQAQKMESIGTLAGGIAHDFNNILYPLLGFAELLKEDLPKDSPLHEHIDEILRATLRSKDLVKQILAFSRKGDQNAKPIKMPPIVKEALKLLRSSIPTTIDIQEDIDSDSIWWSRT
jgi:PAS domain S-box-containing protein